MLSLIRNCNKESTRLAPLIVNGKCMAYGFQRGAGCKKDSDVVPAEGSVGLQELKMKILSGCWLVPGFRYKMGIFAYQKHRVAATHLAIRLAEGALLAGFNSLVKQAEGATREYGASLARAPRL